MAKKPTLTVQLMHANIRIAELEAALADVKAAKPTRSNIKVITRTPWQRPAHMEAARQLAMSTGKVVLV